jgi:hypothetical protein
MTCDARSAVLTFRRLFCFPAFQSALNSFQSGRFLLSFTLLEGEGIVAGFQDVAAVGDAIEQGRGHLGITKNANPFGK